ncbi:HNH endonuclease signature motif containing protein [Sphingomonas aerolata]|uniref:HNH endonuclease n=1 Tax=Sphingomonas aerolata TaxID=185951 RepID=UPI00334FEAED
MSESIDGERRPPIPADIKRRVLVEAGHRCAIPTCRYIETELHHIVPWSQSKVHEYDNLIALCANCHRRADRGEIDRKSLRLYKFNLRFAHDKFSQIELDIIFELGRLGVGQALLWPKTSIIMLKRALDSGYIAAANSGINMIIGSYDAGPATLILTPKGREFLAEIGQHEL